MSFMPIFGGGTVTAVHANKLTIRFRGARERQILDAVAVRYQATGWPLGIWWSVPTLGVERRNLLRRRLVKRGREPLGNRLCSSLCCWPEHRLFIHRLRRGERILEAEPGMTLKVGDVIALSGLRQIIVEVVGRRAEEIEDQDLLDVPITTADVLLIDLELAGKNLGDASREDWTRGLYLRQLSRGGQETPRREPGRAAAR